MQTAKVVALFDGQCVICQSTRHWIQRLDWFRRVQFVDLHDSALVSDIAPDLDHAAMMGEMHVLAETRIYAGFRAIRRILREVPLGFPLWILLQLPGMLWFGSRVYAFIARHRYTVNRWFGIELDADCADGVCKLPQ